MKIIGRCMSRISWWLKKRSLIKSKETAKIFSLSRKMGYLSSIFKTMEMMLSSPNYYFSYKTSCRKYRSATSILRYSRPSNLILSALLALSITDNQRCLANIFKRLGIRRRKIHKASISIMHFKKILRLMKISLKQNQKSNNKIKLSQSL